jgi:antigen flippase
MLKATSALSGAKIVTIGISIIRTKLLAVLLGPSGLGVVNLISSSLDFSRVLFSSGINGATVRKVAEASGLNDPEELIRTYRISVKSAMLLGTSAAVTFACLSQIMAEHLLGDGSKFWWFAIASLSLVCTPLLAVELAFLQGIKQSKALALCQIYASIAGSLVTLILVLTLGLNGAVIALVPVVIVSVLIHRRYAKRHLPPDSGQPIRNFLSEFVSLFRLGSAFALNGIWLTASGWLNILFLTQYYGPNHAPEQIGLNGAANMMANVYVGILISAMGTEFYPRLIAAAKDKSKLNELLNQQTRLSIAIGIPVSAGLLLFAPWILRFLYSPEFVDATEPMRWLILGMVVRFITCPLGFCVYAACKPRTIAINELLTGGTMIAISYLTISTYGLKGVGIGMTLANLLYMIGIAIFMWTQKIRWETRTIFKAVVVMAVCSAILAILIFSASWTAFSLCAGIIALLSILLFNGLRKESDITWEVIRKKLLR